MSKEFDALEWAQNEVNKRNAILGRPLVIREPKAVPVKSPAPQKAANAKATQETRLCAECGQEFTPPKTRAMCCSDACRKNKAGRYLKKWKTATNYAQPRQPKIAKAKVLKPPVFRVCTICHRIFARIHSMQKVCDEQCRCKLNRKHKRDNHARHHASQRQLPDMETRARVILQVERREIGNLQGAQLLGIDKKTFLLWRQQMPQGGHGGCIVCAAAVTGNLQSLVCSQRCRLDRRNVMRRALQEKRGDHLTSRRAQCAVCQDAMTGRPHNALTCSPVCRRAYKKSRSSALKAKMREAKPVKHCCVCDAAITNPDKGRIICSQECSKARSLERDRRSHFESLRKQLAVKPPKSCVICSKGLDAWVRTNTCSDECRCLRKAQRHREWRSRKREAGEYTPSL